MEAVAAQVDAAARKVGAETVVTFDAGGISGPSNHGDVPGCTVLDAERRLQETLRGVRQVWSLVTTNTVRKFVGAYDAFCLILPRSGRNAGSVQPAGADAGDGNAREPICVVPEVICRVLEVFVHEHAEMSEGLSFRAFA